MENVAAGSTVPVLELPRKQCLTLCAARGFHDQMTKCTLDTCALIKTITLSCNSVVEGGVYKDRTSFRLSFRDVRSLYPFNGVSDGVIDFFTRYAPM